MQRTIGWLTLASLWLLAAFQVNAEDAKKKPQQSLEPLYCSQSVCALYSTTAKTKAAWNCGLKKGFRPGNCDCKEDKAKACGKNWRGKTKYTYNCSCVWRPPCKQSICALYEMVAQGKAAYKCGWKKGYKTKKCKCERTLACGKNWRGKTKHVFSCTCK